MKGTAYLIKTITDLHVGGMNSSRDIVDAVVQRDALTDYPCIHSSSLKGALRSAYTGSDENTVFGSAVTSSESAKGTYRFSDAHMLFYPIRSNYRAYYLATCPSMINDAMHLLEISGGSSSELCIALKKLSEKKARNIYGIYKTNQQIKAEALLFNGVTESADLKLLFSQFDEPAVALLSDDAMSETLKYLPINARNYLSNGISKNIWYEENVPRKSVFMFLTMCDDDKVSNDFDRFLIQENQLIQIGADATVGKGFCRLSKVSQTTVEG